MKKLLLIGLLVLSGCAAAKGNKGVETGDVGFQPHDMGTVKSGRDTATEVNLVGGITGIFAISALTLIAYKAVTGNHKK